jgi:hypothetical protein
MIVSRLNAQLERGGVSNQLAADAEIHVKVPRVALPDTDRNGFATNFGADRQYFLRPVRKSVATLGM